MPEHTSSAIILDLRDYGEADRIVTAYTKDLGKITGIAKAARKSQKRFGAAMDLFSHVTLTFFIKETAGLVRIDQCRLLESFPALHEDIVRMSYSSYLAELVKAMSPEGVPHEDIFDGLATLLALLDATGLREDSLRAFEMRLLTAAGYRPSLSFCARCRKQWKKGEMFRFSISRGGVLCERCQAGDNQALPISLGTAKLLEQACALTMEKLTRLVFSPQAREESRQILPRFIHYQLGRELNTFRFLEKLRQQKHEGVMK